ncbi:tyrosine-type recombinase/integrase [Helicobacter sp. 13S00477-4]|uniref:tyrosine-type recombinase/integrase n=1 Tax=Helicobacter sp. 13S00477-4 TaxID=1905759 RepID=UPI000BA73BCB|nr:tyrosine-type recombinase/integrase [Helicobacter sp. 13S00477-4]PAF52704.1 integrase [Helicobacter sp. 13S00477-4]
MRYTLESAQEISSDLLFWCSRFIRYKLTTLSNTNVKNKICISHCIEKLQKGISNISELENICKDARNAGFIGINVYSQPILKLYGYLQNFHSMKDIDEEILSDFLAVMTSGLSAASKKNYRNAIIGLFKYIDKQNQDEKGNSYVYNIELKNIGGIKGKSGQKLPTYLNEFELEKFLNSIDTFEMSSKIRARNRLIIKMIVYTGIRVSEALNLKAKDMILEKDVYLLNIKGKGNKYRMVMIKASHIYNLLEEWLLLRSKIEVKDGLLFCNQKGHPLTQAYIYRNVEEILFSAGIQKEKKGAHMLRHSFATLLYQKRHDLVLVQEALGHADLNTSRIYTHFDKNRLYEAASIMDGFNK